MTQHYKCPSCSYQGLDWICPSCLCRAPPTELHQLVASDRKPRPLITWRVKAWRKPNEDGCPRVAPKGWWYINGALVREEIV